MKNIRTSTPSQEKPDDRRRHLPPVNIDALCDQVVLSQPGAFGPVCITFNMLPSFIGALVCLMRDTGAPPNIFRRVLAEIEAAIPPSAIPAIKAVDLPIITEH